MAKIHEEVLVIKFSKLVRNSDDASSVATAELVDALQAVAEELAGSGVIIEIEAA